MEFEWSEAKRERTLAERALDFRRARDLFDGRPLYSFPSPRGDEQRMVSIGLLGQVFVTVVWLDRNGVRRIISMRRARDGEKERYRSLYR